MAVAARGSGAVQPWAQAAAAHGNRLVAPAAAARYVLLVLALSRARPCSAARRGPGGLEPTGTHCAGCSALAARLARARGAGRALGTRELRGAALRSRLRLAPAR